MIKKIITLLLVMIFATLPGYSVSLERHCSCQNICDCDHSKSTNPIFRNIRCGDNGSLEEHSSTYRQSLLATNTMLHPFEKEALFKLFKGSFTKLLVCSLDPPPPKTVV